MKFADVRYINGFAVIVSRNSLETTDCVSRISVPKIQMFAGAVDGCEFCEKSKILRPDTFRL